METIKILDVNYYLHEDDTDYFPFLTVPNETVDGSRQWLDGYCVVGQHFEVKDVSYLDQCEEISKDEYIKRTEGYYTPKDYLQ